MKYKFYSMHSAKIRRHDLDWLRVMVFTLLILYHVGMFFVNWEWHLKNNVIYDDLGWPMAFINRWRLHILFVISGMGTFYALSYRTSLQFIWERFKRLGLPLVFGMLVIVPPQIFYEGLAKNEFTGSYWSFLTNDFFNDSFFQLLTWNHLWFLPYLLIYSILLIPVFIYIRNHPQNKFIQWVKRLISTPWKLYLFIIPLFLIEGLVEPFFPVTHALVNDWFTFTNFFVLFFYGFILISSGPVFWKSLEKIKTVALITGVLAFTILVFLWYEEDGYIKHFVEALIYVINFWSWILAIFGYAAKYRSKKSKALTYSNRAVYPFYILHQTVIIIIAFWSFIMKFSILTAGTFGTCWIIYDLIILRTPFLHPLFGLKKKRSGTKST